MKKLFYLAFLLFLAPGLVHAQIMQQIVVNSVVPSGGGGTPPTVVQTIPAVTGGGTSGAVCNTFSATPQSITCTMASVTSGNFLYYSVTTSSTLTAINTPTTTGAGCSAVTWTVVGTSTANGALYKSTAVAGGACVVHGTSTSSAGATLQATVREVTTTTNTVETQAIGTVVSSCTSCSAPSASVALTTTVNNDLVICDAVAIGSPGAMTATGTFTNNLNTSGGLPEIGGQLVQVSSGTVAKMTWTATSSGYRTNCWAIEP